LDKLDFEKNTPSIVTNIPGAARAGLIRRLEETKFNKSSEIKKRS